MLMVDISGLSAGGGVGWMEDRAIQGHQSEDTERC
jgi:hypothetical protein